jgi:hypothetical protein
MHKTGILLAARGLLILAVCLFACVPADSQSAPKANSAQNQPTKTPKMEFRVDGKMGEIETAYGVHMGFTYFTASDGVGLTMLFLAQSDQGAATEAFDQEIARAVKVMKRGDKKDGSGRVIGKRAEILTPMSKPAPYPAIIWKDGASFHEIISSSLPDALALEKVYRY